MTVSLPPGWTLARLPMPKSAKCGRYLNVGLSANLNLWRSYEAGFTGAEELDRSMELVIPNYVSHELGKSTGTP